MSGGYRGLNFGSPFFSDPLNGTSGFLDLNNWIVAVKATGSAGQGGNSATLAFTGGALRATLIGNAGVPQQWGIQILATKTFLPCFGKSQFGQLTMVSSGAAVSGMRMGPSALGTAATNGLQGYSVQVSTNDRSGILWRMNDEVGNAGISLVTYGAATFNNGDVLRLEASIGVSSVVLRVYQNGILITTYTDSAANRITTGSPGFGIWSCLGGATGQMDWNTYSGGLLNV